MQFDDNDRAILEGKTEGFVKIHVKRGTDRILGATIVGDSAGDMIRYMMLLLFLPRFYCLRSPVHGIEL